VLEIGVTAALVAGAANWLIIRHHIRRLSASQAQEPGDVRATGPQAQLGDPVRARVSAPMPALIVDENDDAGGHRIHVNPWADEQE